MSNKLITSTLLVDLSTEEQQLLSGGQTGGQPTGGGQSPYGGQFPSNGQPSYPSQGDESRRYPTYICRPVYDDDSSTSGGGQ
ncbi:hypothetical protein NIES21_37490 [Anabaenopsis circularis NIES-21]|uniref:Uncharacterized protein n=2 Tax=Nostocales TaxID=1161 RepID=A0A1Z4GK85_9CYAN|nr:hypothetical protein [Nostoc cycadae]BAY17907.1 hypothetical protein NIES21_37490 [Anabaenopsis circularis NIES-21]GBE91464.1 hypothetical protein NCWK1_1188 [Nostoc cycadae WK-1]